MGSLRSIRKKEIEPIIPLLTCNEQEDGIPVEITGLDWLLNDAWVDLPETRKLDLVTMGLFLTVTWEFTLIGYLLGFLRG
jgi:hypothetical protein